MKHLTPLWTLIENTWKSYKLHFKKLWPLFLLGSIGDLLTRFNFTSRTSPTGNYLAALNHIPMFVIGIAVVAIISILFFLIISKLALFKSITDIHNGKPATVKSAYKKGLNLFWPYVLLSVLIYFTLGGSFVLLVVPFIAFYIYLIFAEAQFFDEDKRHFNALVGSWDIVRNHWWSLVGRLVIIVLLTSLSVYVVIILLLILIAIGTVVISFASLTVGITFAAICFIAFLAFMFLFVEPLSILLFFEVYYDLKRIKAHVPAVTTDVEKKRKRTLVTFAVIGVLIFPVIIYLDVKFSDYMDQHQVSFTTTGAFHSDVAQFSADFLGAPTVTTHVDNSSTTTITTYFFERKIGKSLDFHVSYTVLPSSIDMSSQPYEALSLSMNGAIEGAHAQVISTSMGTYEGLPSNDYLAFSPDQNVYFKARSVVNGNKLYQLLAVYLKDGTEAYSSVAADDFFHSFSVDGYSTTTAATVIPPRAAVASASSVASTTSATSLQKTAYVSSVGKFAINLPVGWSYNSSKISPNSSVDSVFTFSKDQGRSRMVVSKINMPVLREAASGGSDEEITASLAKQGVLAAEDLFSSSGLKGFQVSVLNKQAYGSDTAYVYRGSAAFDSLDYANATYDFELVTIFNGNHGYQLLSIWPESEYGWYADPIIKSLHSFTISN